MAVSKGLHCRWATHLFVFGVGVADVVQRGGDGVVVVFHQQLRARLRSREQSLVLHPIHVSCQATANTKHEVEDVTVVDHPLNVVDALSQHSTVIKTALVFLAPRIQLCREETSMRGHKQQK